MEQSDRVMARVVLTKRLKKCIVAIGIRKILDTIKVIKYMQSMFALESKNLLNVTHHLAEDKRYLFSKLSFIVGEYDIGKWKQINFINVISYRLRKDSFYLSIEAYIQGKSRGIYCEKRSSILASFLEENSAYQPLGINHYFFITDEEVYDIFAEKMEVTDDYTDIVYW